VGANRHDQVGGGQVRGRGYFVPDLQTDLESDFALLQAPHREGNGKNLVAHQPRTCPHPWLLPVVGLPPFFFGPSIGGNNR
jgi:hypothetical protein